METYTTTDEITTSTRLIRVHTNVTETRISTPLSIQHKDAPYECVSVEISDELMQQLKEIFTRHQQLN